jgi:hypothetical protein
MFAPRGVKVEMADDSDSSVMTQCPSRPPLSPPLPLLLPRPRLVAILASAGRCGTGAVLLSTTRSVAAGNGWGTAASVEAAPGTVVTESTAVDEDCGTRVLASCCCCTVAILVTGSDECRVTILMRLLLLEEGGDASNGGDDTVETTAAA